jgi:cytochrome c oxidase assembly factor CtaG
MLATSLVFLLGVYATGVAAAWRRAGYGRGIRPVEALTFAGGWMALVVALCPPLDEWSETWLLAHMIQHELLMVVAAPLVAISAPLIALLWAMPAALRRRALEAARWPPIAVASHSITAPLSVFILHGLALWLWHLPALYEAALEHEGIHVLQHLCFFGTAALFWWGLEHGRYGRIGYGAAVVYVFATAVHGGVLGALLTVSPRVWYAPYSVQHHAGLSPLEDQQLAGLIMWVPAGLVFAAAGLLLFARWLRESDRRTRFNPAPRFTPSQPK